MKKISLEEFIARSQETHGDSYDYSQTIWSGAVSKKVNVICREHGEFYTFPSGHMNRGVGCPKCKGVSARLRYSLGVEQFIKRSNTIHANKYDYSKVVYKNLGDKVEIICPKHGSFWQTPNDHINCGGGCIKCGIESQRLTTEEFTQRAEAAHGKLYDYSRVNYVRYRDKVEIICPKHGSFWQIPGNHIHNESGCPNCSSSIPEQQLTEFIQSISDTEIIRNSKKFITPLELDIYLPEFNLAIEYHGLLWHSEAYNRSPRTLHHEKYKKCAGMGIQLLSIFSNEWLEKPDIVKSIIANKLGKTSNKIFARKCSIVKLTLRQAKDFNNNNHIQSFKGSAKYCYGLEYNNVLVACMIIGKHPRNNATSLNRFCTLLNTNVVGGFSKLLKYAHSQIQKDILTWSDNRWSNGEIYIRNNFQLIADHGPGYEYADTAKEKIIPKQNMQKKKIGCPKNILEYEFVREKYGYYRIWDCGKKAWIYTG